MKSILSTIIATTQLDQYISSNNTAVAGVATRGKILGLSTAVITTGEQVDRVACDRIELDPVNACLLVLSPDGFILACYRQWDKAVLERPDRSPIWHTL